MYIYIFIYITGIYIYIYVYILLIYIYIYIYVCVCVCVCACVCVCVCLCVCAYYRLDHQCYSWSYFRHNFLNVFKSSAISRMWHKVNFNRSLNSEISYFWLVTATKLKSSVWPTIYTFLEGEWLDAYLSQGYFRHGKYKQPPPAYFSIYIIQNRRRILAFNYFFSYLIQFINYQYLCKFTPIIFHNGPFYKKSKNIFWKRGSKIYLRFVNVIFSQTSIRVTHVIRKIGWKVLLREIIWRFQVQSQQQFRIIRNTYYNLTLVPGHG